MKDNYRVDLTVGDNSAEDIQRTINYIVLGGGLLLSLVGGIIIGKLGAGRYGDFEFGPFLVIWIGGSVVSLIVWSTSMILINISDNLRSIKHLLAQQGNGVVITSPEEKNTPEPKPTPTSSVNQKVPSEAETMNSSSGDTKTITDGENSFEIGDEVIVIKSGVTSKIKDIDGEDIYLSNGIFGGTFKVSISEIKHM